MAMLRIFLCGGFSVQIDEQAPFRLPTRKGEMLFAYLVLNQRPFARSELAYLLWQDSDAEQASTNLRKTLFDMRKVVGEWLTVTRQTIAFNVESNYWCDVVEIVAQYRKIETGLKRDQLLTAEQAAVCERVVDFYHGDLLLGVEAGGNDEFEQWLLTERERVQLLVRKGLSRLVAYHLRWGRYTAGILRGQQLVGLDPYDEQGYRLLMRLLARDGQLTAALAQYQRCAEILKRELGVAPAVETAALYERVQQAQKRTHTPLPTFPSPFFGREQDLAHIDHWLDDPHCRLITIVGLGGSGKTRLAVQMAARRRDEFLQGITFVPLAAVETAEGVLLAISHALQLNLHGEQSLKKQIFHYLQEKEMVLVLDNVEQLVEAAVPFIQALLAACPEIKLILTSRENIQIEAERVYRLRGLAHEGGAETEGLSFFRRCVARQHVGFVWSAKEVAAAEEVCRLVEGLPLGIELATAAIQYHSLSEIAREIKQDFDFLMTRRRDVPERHRSMRAMFAYSWRLLDKAEQACLQKLTVFRDGFEATAARQVAQASRFLLNGLIDKSLIRLDGDGRYNIHELLRQFAAEMVADETEARRAHSRYFAQLLENHLPILRGAEQREGQRRLMRDLENIHAAWQWMTVDQESGLVTQAMDGLALFCERKNLYQEGVLLFAAGCSPWHRWEGNTVVHGRLRLRQALFLYRLGRYEESRMLFEQGRQLVGDGAAVEDLATMMFLEGGYYHALADFEAAEVAYRQGLNRATNGVGLHRLADIQIGFAKALSEMGRYEEEKELLDEAYRFFDTTQDLTQLARVQVLLAALSQKRDLQDQSEAMLQATLPLLEELGDRFGVAQVYSLLGNHMADRNEWERSLRYYEEAGSIYKELGTAAYGMKVLGNMGTVYHMLGDYEQAGRLYRESLAVSEQLGDRLEMVFTLSNLGELAYDDGDEVGAQRHLLAALGHAVDLKVKGRIAYILFWLGVLGSEGFSRSDRLAVCLFAAAQPDLPRYDQKFLVETLEGKGVEAQVMAEAQGLAQGLDMAGVVRLFLMV